MRTKGPPSRRYQIKWSGHGPRTVTIVRPGNKRGWGNPAMLVSWCYTEAFVYRNRWGRRDLCRLSGLKFSQVGTNGKWRGTYGDHPFEVVDLDFNNQDLTAQPQP